MSQSSETDPQRGVALVLGAAGGIGRATVTTFRQAGFRVAAADLRPPAAGDDTEPLWLRMDAADESSVRRTVAETVERFGRLDHAVNLVGRVGSGPLVATSAADWRTVLDTNLNSCFFLARHAHPALAASSGSLALCASTNGIDGGSALSGAAYAAAKAAVINLARYLAKEWAPAGIRVNCVVPGPVDTPMLRRLQPDQLERLRSTMPRGRFVQPTEVARVILELCSGSAGAGRGRIVRLGGGNSIEDLTPAP